MRIASATQSAIPFVTTTFSPCSHRLQVRIRQQGFSMRERHLRFFTRFRMLVPSVKGTFTDGDNSLRAAVQSLVGALSLEL